MYPPSIQYRAFQQRCLMTTGFPAASPESWDEVPAAIRLRGDAAGVVTIRFRVAKCEHAAMLR